MENILNFKLSSIDKLEKLKLLAVERKNFFIHDVIEHTILVIPFDLIFCLFSLLNHFIGLEQGNPKLFGTFFD